MKKLYRNNKGITLIALTITIFMIIVLASIAIASMLASENVKKDMYVAQYEKLKKEIENRITPIEEIKLAVSDAIGEKGFDVEEAEKVLKEKLDKKDLGTIVVDKTKKEITCVYKGKIFKINEYGSVEEAEKSEKSETTSTQE